MKRIICWFAQIKKLIAFWDDNSISIDSEKGDIENWFSEDVLKDSELRWDIIENIDGHDWKIDSAIKEALKLKPTLPQCKTIIGKDPNKENTGSSGAPFGRRGVKAVAGGLKIDYD